ncbi:MAG: leucyl/phenylalanyl-tRNA--protein transferase [Gammaproteobacteria bacterium]|jgi:leucyl/phenylalanyl-tRNA--protein transferase|nr:leucyl/phenylalanyl-tRNA--protein transferase [Gammaproteobacteria bacterium]MCW8942017.1 leucyl/phenylalanyl-tRNA--protein transferase [Gammaproteobacteria bacterium]
MSQIPWLEDNNFIFPDVSSALTEPDGLLAASALLTPELVIHAYQQGIFPWYSDGQPVLWWSPDPRCVLFPESFHISRSLKRTLNSNQFEIKTDTSFRQVMLACAQPRIDKDGISESGTWITDAMLQVYCELHEKGIAHSIECWHEGELVGGIYGLVIGDIFFGESMFSKMKDASKVAMHYLCTIIKPYLVDAQVYSEHLQSLGAEEIDRRDFVALISARSNLFLNI